MWYKEAHLTKRGGIHKSLMENDSLWDEFLRKHLSNVQRQGEDKEAQDVQFSGEESCDWSDKGHLRTA